MDAIYQPSHWQQMFHDLTVDEALGAGSAGPGKTRGLIGDPLQQIRVEHARCSGDPRTVAREGTRLFELVDTHRLRWGYSTGWALYLRRSTPMLLEAIAYAKQLFFAVDDGVKFDSKYNLFLFTSGYRFQLGHCHERDDWQIYQGTPFTHLDFDELTQFEDNQYFELSARLRSADPVLVHMLKTRAMSNPRTKRERNENYHVTDPHWVRKYFVDPAPQGKTILERKITLSDGTERTATRIYLPALLKDNPNPAFVRDYEFRLRKLPPAQQAAYLRGDWYALPDAHYADSWDTTIHVCRPFRIPSDWRQFRCGDWGYRVHGCVYWAALDPDGTLYVHREFSFIRRVARQVAIDCRELEERMGLWDYRRKRSMITGPMDTQLWEERGDDKSRTKATEMAKEGIYWVKANKRSRAANSRHFNERLLDHGELNGERRPTPGIVFFNTCKRAIQTIPAIPTDPDNPEAPLEGGEDHWHDAIGYLCAYVSMLSTRKGARQLVTADAFGDDFDEDYADGAPRGRFGYGSPLL